MNTVRDHRRSLLRSRLSRAAVTAPEDFTLAGRTWTQLPETFSPAHSASTETSLRLLGLHPDGAHDGPAAAVAGRRGSMLEMGCGAGLAATSAALAGCGRVAVADINPAAVRNATLNAWRHGVGDRVRGHHTDLFDGLPAGERFDLVFWSSNYVYGDPGLRYDTVHERAYVDAGYRTHERFLAEAPSRLAPGGTCVLHFSSRGMAGELRRIAARHGRGLRVLSRLRVREGDDLVDHVLLEVSARPGPGPAPVAGPGVEPPVGPALPDAA